MPQQNHSAHELIHPIDVALTTEVKQLSADIRPALRAARPEPATALKRMNVMTETATAATTANSAKHSASPFGLPNAEMPKFDPPRMEVPAAFREFAEKGVAQAKDNYEKVQAAAEEMASILEQTYSTAAKGVADYNFKLVEMARTNSNAVFQFACGLGGMKSLAEMVALSTEQARKQFDLVTAQNKELWAIAERMASEFRRADQAERHQGIQQGRAILRENRAWFSGLDGSD